MSPKIIEKYRSAAIIAQNALSVIITQLHQNIGEKTVGEICRSGDRFITAEVNKCFKTVKEKGVARPVEICKNEFVSGIAPDSHDTFQAGIVSEGDVVKVSLGVHIDGYTVMAGHTIVIREEAEPVSPYTGPAANTVIASYLATEAVVSLLSSVLSDQHPLSGHKITGPLIRSVVEEIAATFNCTVVPKSRIRRIKRFVAGQPTVRDSLPTVEWREYSEEDESKLIAELDEKFQATVGHTYLVDIQMAPRLGDGYLKLVDVPSIGSAIEGPSIYTRDQTVTYQLRTMAARQLLSAADKQLSVFPFKLSYLTDLEKQLSINQVKLGVSECVQRHLLVGDPRLKAQFSPLYRPKEAKEVTVSREVTTISLVAGASSGTGYPEVLRLSGGRNFPPSWVHSQISLGSGLAADALNARLSQHHGIKYVEIKPTQGTVSVQVDQVQNENENTNEEASDVEMAIEV